MITKIWELNMGIGSRFHVTILQHCKCNLNCMVWAYLLDILSLSNILEQYY